MKSSLLFAVVQNHIETARHCNYELVQTFVCVTAALSATRNIVKVIDTLDLKGHVPPTFNKCKIAPWISDFGEIDDPAITKAQESASSDSLSRPVLAHFQEGWRERVMLVLLNQFN